MTRLLLSSLSSSLNIGRPNGNYSLFKHKQVFHKIHAYVCVCNKKKKNLGCFHQARNKFKILHRVLQNSRFNNKYIYGTCVLSEQAKKKSQTDPEYMCITFSKNKRIFRQCRSCR